MSLFKSQKHVFWQALVLTLIVFNFGIFLGFMLENSRVGKVNELYAESELSLLDVKIQSEIYSFVNINCDDAVKENIDFANRIYEEAKILDRYETSSRLTEGIKLQHKKYDLLRTLLWLNSIKIKQKCNASYYNLVYFYQYNAPSIEQKAKQTVFSRLLGELKEKHGNNVLLIPIAADNNISSVNVLLKTYNITTLPSVLIDEKTTAEGFLSREDIEKHLN